MLERDKSGETCRDMVKGWQSNSNNEKLSLKKKEPTGKIEAGNWCSRQADRETVWWRENKRKKTGIHQGRKVYTVSISRQLTANQVRNTERVSVFLYIFVDKLEFQQVSLRCLWKESVSQQEQIPLYMFQAK